MFIGLRTITNKVDTSNHRQSHRIFRILHRVRTFGLNRTANTFRRNVVFKHNTGVGVIVCCISSVFSYTSAGNSHISTIINSSAAGNFLTVFRKSNISRYIQAASFHISNRAAKTFFSIRSPVSKINFISFQNLIVIKQNSGTGNIDHAAVIINRAAGFLRRVIAEFYICSINIQCPSVINCAAKTFCVIFAVI